MPQRPPVEPRTYRYWRDPRIDDVCISERKDIRDRSPLEDRATAFSDALLDAGLDFAQAETARSLFDKFSTALAADAVREILLKISATKPGKTPQFRAILAIFSPDRTLEDIASEAGISKQSVHYWTEKLAPLFDTAPALLSGSESPHLKKNEHRE